MTPQDIAKLTPETVVDFIVDVFEGLAKEEYLGEPVTIAEHMLQAATVAERSGLDKQVVIAALLHDVGHFTSEHGTFDMNDTMDRMHEDAGAALLAPFFPAAIVDCVRHHVAAKRYLCAKRPHYFDRLSEASVHSLNLQGGPMSAEEMAAFERLPHFETVVQVRHMDDAGKVAGGDVLPLSHFLPALREMVAKHDAGRAA